MSKSNKVGKVILLGALAGAAAYGVYTYLQKKNESDDMVVEGEDAPKKRSYVSLNLDSAKEYATATYEKAKDAIKKVESKIEESGVFKKSSVEEEPVEVPEGSDECSEEPCEASDDSAVDNDIEPTSSEEFFDSPDPE